MEITIFNEKAGTTSEISFAGNKVNELLKQIDVNPETVLVVRNNEVITEEETLKDKDTLDLLSVISGG